MKLDSKKFYSPYDLPEDEMLAYFDYFDDALREYVPRDDDACMDALAGIVEVHDIRTPKEQILDLIKQLRLKRAKSLGVTDGCLRAWLRDTDNEGGIVLLTDDIATYAYLKKRQRLKPETKKWMTEARKREISTAQCVLESFGVLRH